MGSAEPGPLEEEEEDVGLRLGAMGAEKLKLLLVPAGEAEAAAAAAAAADTAPTGATPDFWANKVPEETGDVSVSTNILRITARAEGSTDGFVALLRDMFSPAPGLGWAGLGSQAFSLAQHGSNRYHFGACLIGQEWGL